MTGKPPWQRSDTRDVVLVVEDEPFVRLLGVDVLEEAGFDVLQASNADEALRMLETHPEVRVVFSDVEMPGSIDGLGLAHCIRRRWPEVGIVLTSGHQIGIETLPGDGTFLIKPYDGTALVWMIEETIR
jgi:two-component system, response regulator PdtaR